MGKAPRAPPICALCALSRLFQISNSRPSVPLTLLSLLCPLWLFAKSALVCEICGFFLSLLRILWFPLLLSGLGDLCVLARDNSVNRRRLGQADGVSPSIEVFFPIVRGDAVVQEDAKDSAKRYRFSC